MLEIPVIRWGKEYESMSKMDVVHFETGETLARVHEANGGLIKMDMKKAKKARNILREFSIQELVDKCAKAGELYENATLPLELIASEKKSPDKNKSKYAQLVSAIKSSHSSRRSSQLTSSAVASGIGVWVSERIIRLA